MSTTEILALITGHNYHPDVYSAEEDLASRQVPPRPTDFSEGFQFEEINDGEPSLGEMYHYLSLLPDNPDGTDIDDLLQPPTFLPPHQTRPSHDN